jgi:hypothetical protein
MLHFHGCVPYNKKIVYFNLLALLLNIFSSREGEIRVHAFLIHMCSPSDVADREQLQTHSWYNMHNTHTLPSSGLLPCSYDLWPTAAYWLRLGTLNS